MSKEAKNKVNRSDLALVFGVAPTTVDAWIKAGCPYLARPTGRGKGWQFDTAAVGRWREQVAADAAAGKEVQDEAALRVRKLAVEARAAELALAKSLGEVAPIEQMERALSRVFAEVQSNLRGVLVTRLARQLLGETDERRFKRVTLAEIDAALVSLAEMDVAADDENPSSAARAH